MIHLLIDCIMFNIPFRLFIIVVIFQAQSSCFKEIINCVLFNIPFRLFTWILILFFLPHSVLTWRYPPAARRLFTALCGAFIMSLVVDFNILLFIMGKFLIHHFHTFFLIFPFISHVTSFNHVPMQCMNYAYTNV